MKIEVMLLAGTSVDWTSYLVLAKKALGRSVTAQLDVEHMPSGNNKAFVATLGSIRNPDLKASSIVNNPGSLLKHLSYSFIVMCDSETLLSVIEDFSLHVLSTDSVLKDIKFAVVSGNLESWRNAFINGCSESSTYELRFFLDKCLVHLEQEGVGNFWSNYYKRNLSDKTFILLEKSK